MTCKGFPNCRIYAADCRGNSCDDTARHVNAPQSFIKKHEKEAEEMKKIFIDHVKAIYPRNQRADGGNSESTAGGMQQQGARPVPRGGKYPSLLGLDVDGLSKQKLVDAMRNYCTQHYSESRQLISLAELNHNSACIGRQIQAHALHTH